MDLKQFREIIREKPLIEQEATKNPFLFLQEWIQEAIDSGIRQPNAMNLATTDGEGNPRSRVVLLKEVVENKLTFFTNYQSPKSIEILNNNNVSLNFLWFDINRQIRIQGTAKKTSREYSEKYFKSRPKDSQIAAVISSQSEIVSSREELEKKYNDYQLAYKDKDIPCPEYWGGFEVEPTEFEFWQGRVGRLHDRLLYKKESDWEIKRLNP